jgi:hypothetical protein
MTTTFASRLIWVREYLAGHCTEVVRLEWGPDFLNGDK